jgi:molybdate transport system substrate-binding protein
MRYLSSAVLALTLVHAASAEEVNAAVAANFTAAMKEIAANFEAATGHKAVLSFGSTGKLYAQIENGAPFDLFLAADRRRPMLLETQGVASGRFTYAVGKLVLWSPAPALADDGEKVLAAGNFTRLAIANPETAPYGAAAVQVLKALGLYHALQEKLVRGENIAQTYQFVATQNAQLGFVALAQIVLSPEGSRWEVPDAFYDPIRQDAVLLRTGINKPAATALFAYLKSPAARAVIEKFGYGIE